jgi:hypothetical protein
MNTIETKSKTRLSKWGWGIHLAVTGLLVLNSVGLYIFIASTREEQTTAILLGGLGFLALVVALEGARHHSRPAWNAVWVLVGALSLIGVHITVLGELTVGVFYLSLAGITLVGQFLAGSEQAVSRNLREVK